MARLWERNRNRLGKTCTGLACKIMKKITMKLLIITQKVDARDQLLGFFIDWIKKFSEKFEKITVLCLERGEFSLPENVEVISLGKEENNFQFSIFNFQSILNVTIFKKIIYLLKFYRHIWRERKNYNTVFIHMNPIWVVLGGWVWHLLNKKIFFWYTSGGVTTKLKLAEKFAHIIFTASKESFRLPSKKVIVTGHGIDTNVFRLMPKNVRNDGNVRDVECDQFEQTKRSNSPNNSIKILSVGRIAPVKNYEILIGAAKILKDKGIDFSITMVGEAPLDSDTRYLTSLKLKVKGLKLEDNFNFVGKVNHKDLPSYYQSHDIFIHLSKTGSLDKTILEAMACGMKVLSSSDSARSFLSPELIFNESNSSELADKIVAVKDKPTDPALRDYVIKNHNLDVLIEKISQIINQQ